MSFFLSIMLFHKITKLIKEEEIMDDRELYNHLEEIKAKIDYIIGYIDAEKMESDTNGTSKSKIKLKGAE